MSEYIVVQSEVITNEQPILNLNEEVYQIESEEPIIESEISSKRLEKNKEILDNIAINFPELYHQVKNVDFTGLIKEIMQQTLEIVANDNGYSYVDHIINVHDEKLKSFNGGKIVGAIKNSYIPLGLGIVINDSGITFVTEKTGSNKEKIKELREQIENMYIAVANIYAQKLLGYEVDVRTEGRASNKSVVINAQKVVG